MKTNKERKHFLKQELKEYEKVTPMALLSAMKAVIQQAFWMFTGRKRKSGGLLLPGLTKKEAGIFWGNMALTGTGNRSWRQLTKN